MPALAIPIEVLRARGAEVAAVTYRPDPWPDWRRAERGDWSEISRVLVPQVDDILRDADRVTVVAKSMGTSAFPALLPVLPASCDAIWITPLTNDADVCASIGATNWRSLFVFGTADPAHNANEQAKLGGTMCAIEAANHMLVVAGDDAATDAGFAQLRAAIEAFL